MEEPDPPENSPSFLMPALWLGSAALVTVLAVGAVAAMGYGSESAGVAASNLAAFPLGFVCAGAPAALIVHFLVKRGPLRVAMPLGCGCLGSAGLFASLLVFYAAIWPSL